MKTSKTADAVKAHHRSIEQKVIEHVSAIVEGTPSADPAAFVAFLKNDLLPHAEGEERHLYPVIDELVRSHGRATATMSIDHEFIESCIGSIERTVAALAKAPPDERAALQTRLQRLAIGLEMLLEVHIAKEERIYLPLFSEHVSQDEQRRIIDAMHEDAEQPEPRRLGVQGGCGCHCGCGHDGED